MAKLGDLSQEQFDLLRQTQQSVTDKPPLRQGVRPGMLGPLLSDYQKWELAAPVVEQIRTLPRHSWASALDTIQDTQVRWLVRQSLTGLGDKPLAGPGDPRNTRRDEWDAAVRMPWD